MLRRNNTYLYLVLVTAVHGALIFGVQNKLSPSALINFSENKSIEHKVSLKIKSYQKEQSQMKEILATRSIETVAKKVAINKNIKKINAVAKGQEAAGEISAYASYMAQVRSLINDFKYYPEQLVRRGIQGVVNISFLISSDGTVIEGNTKLSDVHILLKRAALKTLSRIDKFPIFPKELDKKTLEVSIPIDYQLK